MCDGGISGRSDMLDTMSERTFTCSSTTELYVNNTRLFLHYVDPDLITEQEYILTKAN